MDQNKMADGGDTLGSLPPPRVKFKDQMEDIREATIEGSQFEAQFPEERVPVPLPLVSSKLTPRPQTPRQSNTTDTINRPKTTLRRTTSERSVIEEDEPALSLSRKPTNEQIPRKGPYDSPTISRKSTQELLGKKTPAFDSPVPFSSSAHPKSGTVHHTSSPVKHSAHMNSAHRASEHGEGFVSDRTDYSRHSSQLSFQHPRSDSIGRSARPTPRLESGYKLSSRNASAIVQKKGKVMENGW